MGYLIFILVPFTLLVGLFVLVGYEARRGVRLFAPTRARLDEYVRRGEFIVTHVDFKAFISDLIRHAVQRVAHNSAHVSLMAVRAVERLLTRMVRHLRAEHATSDTPRESTREFVKTLSDFKDQLKETPPEIPDILEN